MPENKKKPNKTGEGKAKILIVDDHHVLRRGLMQVINEEPDLEVTAEAENAQKAMKAIRELKPDIVIVDISLRETSGLELIKDINVQYPNLPILTLSFHEESIYAERALRTGAKGYIMKVEPIKKIVAAIRQVMDGKLYLSDIMVEKMLHNYVSGKPEVITSTVDCLSNRELEVFCLIGQGHGISEIAEKLHLSRKTIETHRVHIKEKLKVTNADELRQYAVKWVDSQNR